MKLLEISTGPLIETPIQLSNETKITPLGPLGAGVRVDVLSKLLGPRDEVLKKHFAELRAQAQLAEHAILIEIDVSEEVKLNPETWEGFARPVFERARNALTLVFGEGFAPFAEIAILGQDVGINLIFPRARGLRLEKADQRDFSREAKQLFSTLGTDQRFGFLLSLYDLASRQEDARYRVAHLFSCLEALAAGRFTRCEGQGSRDAVRMMLGYGYRTPFPLFQIAKGEPVEVDHIGVAGRVRDQLFHGLSSPNRAGLEAGFNLYEQRPEFLAFALSCDCLTMFLSGKHARPERPEAAPERKVEPNSFRCHLITETRRFGCNVGVWLRTGEKRGELYIAFWFRDFTGGGIRPFKITVPGGRGPIVPADKLGYLIELDIRES